MLLILYIVQAICNQTLPPGTPTQLEQILLVFCFYLIYINLLFEMLSLYIYIKISTIQAYHVNFVRNN
jgi:hypothetical protein